MKKNLLKTAAFCFLFSALTMASEEPVEKNTLPPIKELFALVDENMSLKAQNAHTHLSKSSGFIYRIPTLEDYQNHFINQTRLTLPESFQSMPKISLTQELRELNPKSYDDQITETQQSRGKKRSFESIIDENENELSESIQEQPWPQTQKKSKQDQSLLEDDESDTIMSDISEESHSQESYQNNFGFEKVDEAKIQEVIQKIQAQRKKQREAEIKKAIEKNPALSEKEINKRGLHIFIPADLKKQRILALALINNKLTYSHLPELAKNEISNYSFKRSMTIFKQNDDLKQEFSLSSYIPRIKVQNENDTNSYGFNTVDEEKIKDIISRINKLRENPEFKEKLPVRTDFQRIIALAITNKIATYSQLPDEVKKTPGELIQEGKIYEETFYKTIFIILRDEEFKKTYSLEVMEDSRGKMIVDQNSKHQPTEDDDEEMMFVESISDLAGTLASESDNEENIINYVSENELKQYGFKNINVKKANTTLNNLTNLRQKISGEGKVFIPIKKEQQIIIVLALLNNIHKYEDIPAQLRNNESISKSAFRNTFSDLRKDEWFVKEFNLRKSQPKRATTDTYDVNNYYGFEKKDEKDIQNLIDKMIAIRNDLKENNPKKYSDIPLSKDLQRIVALAFLTNKTTYGSLPSEVKKIPGTDSKEGKIGSTTFAKAISILRKDPDFANLIK